MSELPMGLRALAELRDLDDEEGRSGELAGPSTAPPATAPMHWRPPRPDWAEEERLRAAQERPPAPAEPPPPRPAPGRAWRRKTPFPQPQEQR